MSPHIALWRHGGAAMICPVDVADCVERGLTRLSLHSLCRTLSCFRSKDE